MVHILLCVCYSVLLCLQFYLYGSCCRLEFYFSGLVSVSVEDRLDLGAVLIQLLRSWLGVGTVGLFSSSSTNNKFTFELGHYFINILWCQPSAIIKGTVVKVGVVEISQYDL